MPTSNLPAGIILTSMEWFERCLIKQCTVFHFPSGRKPKVKSLAPGSTCLILVRPSRGTPREEWIFVGELVVKSVKLVSGKEFQDKYASRAVEIDILFPKPREKAWIIEFEQLVKYERPVKLKECTDIKTSTSKKPLSDWKIVGFTFIRPVDAHRVVEAIRRKAETLTRPVEKLWPPPHDVLVEELIELGKWLSFIVKKRSIRLTGFTG